MQSKEFFLKKQTFRKYFFENKNKKIIFAKFKNQKQYASIEKYLHSAK